MTLKSIEEFDLTGKKVFIRVDFNVALAQGPSDSDLASIRDDTRIRAALETIQYARNKEAKVILASHLGRPGGKPDPKLSLLPVAQRLSELLDCDVILPDSCVGDGARKLVQDLKPGEILLLENLRFCAGETKNDSEFANELNEFCDVYINDAFGTMHRAHASTAALPLLNKERGMGFLVKKELAHLGKLLKNPDHPFVGIIGGNKISDKIGIIRQLLPRVDHLLIVGGMAYTFLMQQGYEVGQSKVELNKLKLAKELLQMAKEQNSEIILPRDHIVADQFSETAQTKIVKNSGIPSDWMGLDIGPETISHYRGYIEKAKTIFWNGPAGVFEMVPFCKGTLSLARFLAESNATTVIGGGDSVAAIKMLKLENEMSLISTGGGATLEFLSGKTLPGVQSLELS